MHLRRRAEAVSRLYRRLDLHTRSFRSFSGLECPSGCGQCCLSREVEATVLEMLPAAFDLLRAGQLEQMLARLEAVPPTCLLYEPAGLPGGHCGLYRHRALLCRLFGFAASLDREGRRKLQTCRLIRSAMPQTAARADEAVRSGAALVPVMRNYQMELYGIDPSLGAQMLPINAALARALEMVGLANRGARGWRRAGPVWRRAGPVWRRAG